MKDLLAPPQRSVIEQLGWARTLVAFDYDGTLAPIVDNPAQARMRRTTRNLLSRVATRYPCAVVSGRSRDDAALWLDGVGVRSVVGNHGLEPWDNPVSFERSVARWRATLTARLDGLDGVRVEDKRFSLAIHYRAAPARRAAEAAIRAAVAPLEGARIVGGKCVVNVMPADAPGKGIAVLRLRDEQGCDTALFVGDDDTDEDVFEVAEPGRLLGVRVGRSRKSAASYYLEDQLNIDELLRALLEARPSPAHVRQEHHVLGL